MNTPQILSGAYGREPLAADNLLTLPLTSPQDGHAEIGIGSLLLNESGKGWRAVKTGEAAAGYYVDAILNANDHSYKRVQYLTAAEAGGGNYVLRVFPLGGLKLLLAEDGDGAIITDADLVTKKYYEVVVGAINTTEIAMGETMNQVAVHANILIDSSTGATASTGGTAPLIEILEVFNVQNAFASVTNAPTSWATASKGRVFVCRIIPSLVTESQA